MNRRVAWAALFALAAAAALAPMPSRIVERWYSRGTFPVVQHALTSLSNLVPFALFDALWIGAAAALAVLSRRAIRAHGWRRGLLRTVFGLARAAAVVYLLFLATWGLNYRRVPLLDKLEFEPARVTKPANAALADWVVTELNTDYGAAHSDVGALDSLRRGFDDTVRALNGTSIVPGRPKPTLLGWYFHTTSIAGMTDPFLLETMLAPDLLDVERPFVIAHEWAHLAGFADESEANFVAYLTCRRGDATARYSAALILTGYTRSPRMSAPPWAPGALALGPRIDIFAMAERYSQGVGVLRFAAREGYDKYLKANRVERGIESYDAVIELILGTTIDETGYPKRR